jgi:glycerophosphoryl diester phosphodiesterase
MKQAAHLGKSLVHPFIVGHRGGSFACPENTKAAVEWAFAHGADGVEMDLQQTKDGTVVVLHDDSLARTATDTAKSSDEFAHICKTPVSELQWGEIKDVDIGLFPLHLVVT